MCKELRDIRSKVDERTDAALNAFARAQGLDKSELIRVVLTEWAEKQIHGAMLVQRLLRAEGVIGECQGVTGESQGTRGNRP